MRYRLRTLLIVLAIMPPVLAGGYARWQRYKERQNIMRFIREQIHEGEIRRAAFRDGTPLPPPLKPF